ncbi:MAG: hypothetical protein IKU78_03365 [Paludibacteraceae bacterium]|nr:hypothetical protein [Paludibacteraceae bacterium]
MKEYKDIRDDQIRIIGDKNEKLSFFRKKYIALCILGIIIGIIIIIVICTSQKNLEEEEPGYFEPTVILPADPIRYKPLGRDVDSIVQGFVEIRDTSINDIPFKIYIPHNAEMSLHIGKINKEDTTIVYVAQAADVRADNGNIVGAFVLKGEPRAWGLSKKGFCASINGKITVGVAENSPLFEKATEEGGYFFRQYPLVSNGKIVENEPKGKSIRRGICDRKGEIFMVETLTPESFHDFAQALVDLGVGQAIYLVGSSAYGWAVDEYKVKHEFGIENQFTYYRRRMPKNTSYIVWKRSN